MDQERGRDFRKKKYLPHKDKEDKQMKRPIILMKSKDAVKTEEPPPPQTILLKRDAAEKRPISPQALKKDDVSNQVAQKVAQVESANLVLPRVMSAPVKFLDDALHQIQDGILEFLTDANDFLVVGCVGTQGVGKSTIISHLISNSINTFRNLPFKEQSNSNIETSTHATQGMDIYVTPERVILIDSQPILSLSVLAKQEPRSSSRDESEHPCQIENDIEILSLQHAAFLLSVCHVVLVIQDFIYDPEIHRFLQIAEMLKPSTGMQSDDEALVEYFPHIVFVHNKTKSSNFNIKTLKKLQEVCKKNFSKSQLVIQSGIGIANGSVLKTLSPEFCGDPINIFLLPSFRNKEKKKYELITYRELIKALRYQINGLSPSSLTNSVLSEKNWFYYASKVWETVKKSPIFPEYARLLRNQTQPPSEIDSSCSTS